MLAETRRKVDAAGVAAMVTVQPLDFSEVTHWTLGAQTFDGVYSNYGALNCIGSWRNLGTALAQAVRPGGMAGLCLIGRWCPWEIGWHGLHGHWRTALRRLPGKAIAHLDGNTFPVYYPTVGQLARDLGESWQRQDVSGVGVWLPPSDLYNAVGRRPRWHVGCCAWKKRLPRGGRSAF